MVRLLLMRNILRTTFLPLLSYVLRASTHENNAVISLFYHSIVILEKATIFIPLNYAETVW